MKYYILLLSSLLLLLPVLSSADNRSNMAIQSEILSSGDILVISKNNGKPLASYFSTKRAKKEMLAKRIIHILKLTNASKSIINFAELRLHRHPSLKKAKFKVPLTDDDGTVYKFTYSSDMQSGLFTLNYQYMGISK